MSTGVHRAELHGKLRESSAIKGSKTFTDRRDDPRKSTQKSGGFSIRARMEQGG
jgi:hypothetical protein